MDIRARFSTYSGLWYQGKSRPSNHLPSLIQSYASMIKTWYVFSNWQCHDLIVSVSNNSDGYQYVDIRPRGFALLPRRLASFCLALARRALKLDELFVTQPLYFCLLFSSLRLNLLHVQLSVPHSTTGFGLCPVGITFGSLSRGDTLTRGADGRILLMAAEEAAGAATVVAAMSGRASCIGLLRRTMGGEDGAAGG